MQLFAGIASDTLGRRWLCALGLWTSASGLLVAALGAGYHGALLGSHTASTPAALAELQFGYLVLSSCLLGLGSGLMYSVSAWGVTPP